MDKYEIHEKYEQYEYQERSRKAHRYQNGRKRPGKLSQDSASIKQQLTDFSDDITDFIPTYARSLDPLHHERQWVINSVAPFYQDNIITDVIRLAKGGKEANVYSCLAHPATGVGWIAAKLYRPRMLRHLKNDAVYKAGRQLRSEEGKEIKGRRVMLALRKKTRFGKKVDIQWWIGNEFLSQKALFEAGADVPEPIAHSGNAVLMSLVGGDSMPAPTLSEVKLELDEARPLFERIMGNVALMLDLHLIHGDLSAYNILYWQGDISIIDFPQMVDARTNPHAFELLGRDVARVCQYFSPYGIETDPESMVQDLWQPYMGRER